MKNIYIALCGLLVLLLLVFGGISLIDRDAVSSEMEERELKTFPAFSVSGLLSGSFGRELEEYYADTFPGREGLLESDGIVSTFFDFGDLKLEEAE
jgi:hypothetical protein